MTGTPRLAALVVATGVAVGLAAGVGGYTFVYARGSSYLTNDPAACANCHLMQEQLDGWAKSPHRHVAVCNDCHAPHGLVGKYRVKATNGFRHSLAFTTGRFPDPPVITAGNRRVAEAACRHCHAPMVEAVDASHTGDDSVSCIRCHSNVGHMREIS